MDIFKKYILKIHEKDGRFGYMQMVSFLTFWIQNCFYLHNNFRDSSQHWLSAFETISPGHSSCSEEVSPVSVLD